ncbi:helix-turn-helix transcriptional regulator [Qipengyuania flava]|uniref:helix-turn-helix transcriptional regulator n=1 Tax=Qipengyuania flava TaxID=192812 RepID=UPI001C6269EA|nr:LuxR C-terminal-related transcriptional regulator [Qipengyuania flava]QYJ08339.1 LuxR family transcriptional regulator [Qipengyuania flava]
MYSGLMHGPRHIASELSNDAAARFRRSAQGCSTIAALNIACLRLAARIGATGVAYHHFPAVGSLEPVGINVICVGFPREWSDHFEQNQLMKVEPTIQVVLAEGRAQWWDETEPAKRLSKAEREYLEQVNAHVGVGVHLPTYGPFGRDGYVAIEFGHEKPAFDEDDLANLQLCCQAAHQQYCQLLRTPLSPKKRLSPREREILAWVAEGKSNGVIAEILEITESSVITYLERAFKKLEVDNRVTAALRASATGELAQL